MKNQLRFIPAILALGFAVLFLSSCSKKLKGSGDFITQFRIVPAFHEVEHAGTFEIEIFQDSAQTLSIRAEDNVVSEIETSVNNGRVSINFKDKYESFDIKTVTIRIGVPVIDGLFLVGTGNITCEDTFTTTNSKIEMTGTGNITYKGNCDEIDATVIGTGDIILFGTSQMGKYKISGTGNIKAFEMSLQTASAEIVGTGNCEVDVAQTLAATITGTGDIIYEGTPIVSTTITGTGVVRPR